MKSYSNRAKLMSFNQAQKVRGQGQGYGAGDDFWYPSMRSPPHTPDPAHELALERRNRNLGLALCPLGLR